MQFIDINRKVNKYIDNQEIQYSNSVSQEQDPYPLDNWKKIWTDLNDNNFSEDNLYEALNIAYTRRIQIAMFLHFLYYQFTMIIPLLAFYIFENILRNTYKSSENIILVFIVITIKCLKPFIRIWSEGNLWQIGQSMQSKISKELISKIFKTSFLSNKTIQSSEVIKIMQIDIQKIRGYPFYRSYVWFNTYSTAFNILLIAYLFGVAGLLGILTLIFTLVLRFCFKKTIDKYQEQLDIETGNRVKKTIDVLNIIKFIKVSALEIPYLKKLFSLRQNQLNILYNKNIFELIPLFALASSVRIVILVVILVLINRNQQFNSAIFFTLNFIFVNLNFQYIFLHLTNLNEAKMSLRNISKFLNTQQINTVHILYQNDINNNQNVLMVRNGNFYWERQIQNQVINQIQTIHLKNINLQIKKGEFISIVGKFGSGKSSLFNAILGEMKNEGKSEVIINGSVAYVNQKSWILNDSIRNNIIFGYKFNEERYNSAIHYSCLEQDLQILRDRDETIIGQRGCTLSGGQKTRISLARALYSNAQIYLLDDVLSAVDAHVGSFIFFQTLTKYLQGKTILLITHSLHFIQFTHRIFIMDNFQIIEAKKKEYLKNNQVLAQIRSQYGNNVKKDVDFYQNTTMKYEMGPRKNVDFALNQFIKRCGGFKFLLLSIILIALVTISAVLVIFWINYWANSLDYKNPFFMYIYLLIVIFSALTSIIVWYYISHLPILFEIYKDMVKGLLFTSLSYFETTHIAKIIHGLSNDLNKLDKIVLIQYWSFTSHFGIMLNFAISIFYIYISNQHYIILLIFTLYLAGVLYKQMRYVLVMQAYGEVEDQFKVTVNSFFTQSVQGQATIRAYRKEEQRKMQFQRLYRNYNQINVTIKGIYFLIKYLMSITSSLYLSFVLIYYFYVESFSQFEVFLLVSILSLQEYLDRYNQNVIQFLIKLKYLSKCQELAKIQPQFGYKQLTSQLQSNEDVNSIRLVKQIFSSGSIQFVNVCVRYKSQNENVLKNISIRIKGGEKIGIVGRTGSGKSTLFLALLRILQTHKGNIFIDGIDISSIQLDALRKNINFILQDHFLFAGTIRENVDPSQQHTDKAIQQVLRLCNIWNNLQQKQKLETIVAQGGQNFSIGERQLLNIARSLLTRKKIVLIDEATANIDPQTDEIIQKVLNNHFKQCTMLTIAHRINTIINCDRILVLDQGEVKEFDSPSKLIMKQTSLFSKLYEESTRAKSK